MAALEAVVLLWGFIVFIMGSVNYPLYWLLV